MKPDNEARVVLGADEVTYIVESSEPVADHVVSRSAAAIRTTLQAGDRKVTVPLSPQIVEDGVVDGWWSGKAKETLRIVEGHDAE